MTIKQRADEMLERFKTYYENGEGSCTLTYQPTERQKRYEDEQTLKYITEKEYVSMLPSSGGYFVSFLSKGIEYFEKPTISHVDNVPMGNTYNISSIGNAIVGNQGSMTINYGSTLSDIQLLINQLPKEELCQSEELMALLKQIEANNKPIEKDSLSKFSDLLARHTPLVTAVGGWLVKLLSGFSAE